MIIMFDIYLRHICSESVGLSVLLNERADKTASVVLNACDRIYSISLKMYERKLGIGVLYSATPPKQHPLGGGKYVSVERLLL